MKSSDNISRIICGMLKVHSMALHAAQFLDVECLPREELVHRVLLFVVLEQAIRMHIFLSGLLT